MGEGGKELAVDIEAVVEVHSVYSCEPVLDDLPAFGRVGCHHAEDEG